MTRNASQPRLKAVIFDLDGTIADSFDVFIGTLQEILKRPDPLSPEELTELRGLPLKEIIARLDIKKWQLPLMVIKGRSSMTRKVDRIDIFDGMPEVIRELSAANCKLFMLSTGADKSIRSLLGRYGLLDCFSGIYSDVGLTGKAKIMKKLMKKEGFTPSDCLYVGNETRDIEASRKAGISCISVGWGFSSPAALKAHKPAVLVTTPRELTRVILDEIDHSGISQADKILLY
jgi:phosphoglycolate phosphatase